MAAGTLNLAAGDHAGDHAGAALLARFPTIVAAYARLRQGQEPVAPRADLGHAANYLYMLHGESPTPVQAQSIERYLTTVSDHGLNASTFAARTIISTLLLHGLGLDTDLFTPTFAIGRLAGWIGHCLEQGRHGRLIRPQSRYTGQRGRQWVPLASRGPATQ